jgi:hypothetical protein
MTTDDLIQMLTGGLTPKERENVLRWIASLLELDYIEVYYTAAKKYYQLKDGHPDIAGKILHYCGLILSAREYGWDTLRGKGYRVAGDNQLEDWQKIRKMRIQNLRSNHNARIRRQILGHWGEIIELKNDGVGFRKISQYLKQYKKLNVSSSYVHKIWKEMEK